MFDPKLVEAALCFAIACIISWILAGIFGLPLVWLIVDGLRK